MRRRHEPRRRVRVLLVGSAVALLAGCTGGSSGPDPQPTLVLPSGSSPFSCQEHQEQPPGSDYAGGAESADTARVLTLLRYWNENGDKPYCDGEPATDVDTAWADLVQRLLDNEPAPSTTPAPTT